MNEPFDIRIQRQAEEHLRACQEALYDEDVTDGDYVPSSPSSAPFCGCETCVVREVLSATWEELVAEAQRLTADETTVHIQPDQRKTGMAHQTAPRTFLVWRYDADNNRLLSEHPEVAQADSPEDAANLFYQQALVVEAHVGEQPE